MVSSGDSIYSVAVEAADLAGVDYTVEVDYIAGTGEKKDIAGDMQLMQVVGTVVVKRDFFGPGLPAGEDS